MNQRMKKNIIKIFLIFIFFILIISVDSKSYARSYSIENMDIKATILENGSINVVQSITYNFNGSYNGIYITIPYNLQDKEFQEANKIEKNNKIYNGDSVIVNSIVDSKNTEYTKASSASNGASGKYTVDNSSQKYTIKVYSPSQDTKKVFILNYNINNVCISHKDVGELYYNFIGGEWDTDIKNLNIDIMLPNNKTQEDLYAFGHGPYNGIVTIVSQNQVNFKVSNVKKGQYVAARLVFNKDNIKDSTKIMNINALETIMKEEKNIYENRENKQKFTSKVLIFATILFIYWIILLVVFEKDKKYVTAYSGEQELFKKYNPLIAGCIQGSREILARDIIAVILNLIEKNIIKMNVIESANRKEPYIYMLQKTDNDIENMDDIEKYIYNWLFGIENKIDFAERLKDMPKEKTANKKFKELNNMAKKQLNKIGANNSKVPTALKIFNDILFFISIYIVFVHFQYNKLSIYNPTSISMNVLIIFELGFVLLPIFMGMLWIPINLLVSTRHRVHKIIRKFTGQKIVTTSTSIVLIFFVIILLTTIFTQTSRFLIADELLIGIALLIVLTDNLMLKNDVMMIEDYSRLNMIKNKLQDDTLFEQRDIEQVVLWGQYLAYGVAFGVTNQITKKMKEMHIDDDLNQILKSTNMLENINSGYYDFYLHASLDRRFVKSYTKATEKILTSIGEGSGSRRIFWWRRPEAFREVGGFSGGGGGGRGPEEHSKKG